MTVSSRRRLSAAFAAVCTAALAAGCDSVAKSEALPANPDASVRACERYLDGAPWHGVVRVSNGRDVAFDAGDDYFKPTCVVVPRSTRVRLVVTNRGHLPHTVTLPGAGLNEAIDAGQTVFVTLPATAHPLRFVCTYHVSEHMFFVVVPSG